MEKEGKVEGLPSGAPISPVWLGRQETGPHQAELPASLTGSLAEGLNLDTKGDAHHCHQDGLAGAGGGGADLPSSMGPPSHWGFFRASRKGRLAWDPLWEI